MCYKRKIALLLAVVLSIMFMSGCAYVEKLKDTFFGDSSTVNPETPPEEDDGEQEELSGEVYFIDVGQGDCFLLKFPDGKNMLIDCGPKNSVVSEKIINFLEDKEVDKLDYLVLTHPDLDHIGGAMDIINAVDIDSVYIPDIYEGHLSLFPEYKQTVDLIKQKQIEVYRSDCYKVLTGEGYGVAFLSPKPKILFDSSYYEFHQTSEPTDALVNSLSPIIYVDILGVRFMFTGDAPIAEEERVLDWLEVYESIYYTNYGLAINLPSIDFLKVGHHGANDSSGSDFLLALTPKNAIISVSGSSSYVLPSTQMLNRLVIANPSVNILRTDIVGHIFVDIEEDGSYKTQTQADFS